MNQYSRKITTMQANDPFSTLIQGDPFIAIMLAVFFLLCAVFVGGLILRQIKLRRDRAGLSEGLAESLLESSPEALSEFVAESWSDRLHSGLSRTRAAFANSFGSIFGLGTRFSEELLEQIHEALYRADFGVQTTDLLVDRLRQKFQGHAKNHDTGHNNGTAVLTWEQIRPLLVTEIQSLFTPQGPALKSTSASPSTSTSPQTPPPAGPHVILIVGVNGVGKTTTIGKLAAWYQSQGKKVLLGAGDTFRAAAIDQLQTWADRVGVDLVKQQPGSDPAAVAFDTVKSGKARNADVIIIDTAGRLHNKEGLMAELAKINRSIAKELPGAPHETLLVIDATTGQNAVQQVRAFNEVVKLTGLVATKLDGTAKGGVLVGIAHQFQVPIAFIGVGEKVNDLRPFDASEFVSAIF